MIEIETKKCARCTAVKPVAEFYPRRSQGSATLHSYCKPCSNEVTQLRREMLGKVSDRTAREHAERLVAEGPVADFKSLPLAVRAYLLDMLDTEGRSVTEVVALAGCSIGTVYRQRKTREEQPAVSDAHVSQSG